MPDSVDELDAALLRLENLLADERRTLPPEERVYMQDLIERFMPDRRRGPPRTTAACHELVLDMQGPELEKRLRERESGTLYFDLAEPGERVERQTARQPNPLSETTT